MMTKKILFGLWTVCVLIGLFWVCQSSALTIGGVVRQPLNLSLEDLAKFENTTVRLNEVTGDNQFHGVFIYRGVPLKLLLGLASIQKEESGFQKPLDLAVIVRNKSGKTAVLSWGEIFYRNPGDLIVAFSGTPVMPSHTNCGACHGPAVYEPALNQLKRKIEYPKLVVANDFFTDRSLEDVVNIEVVEMKQKTDKKQIDKLFSPKFVVIDGKGKSIEISDLAGYTRLEVPSKNVGDGRGYHGWKRFSGAALRDILTKAGVKGDTDTAVLISSVDGYRSLISYGELFMAPGGERIVVADRVNGVPLKEGKFTLLFPDDTAADRMMKALSRIEIVSLKGKSKLSIIGMGCADTSLITLEAISSMGKADAFVVTEDIRKRFSKYIGDKPVLFDPMKNMSHMFKRDNPNLSEAQAKEKLEAQRSRNNQQIKDALKAGKSVAILEYGDPAIYPPWQGWLEDGLRGQVEIVPGMSAFNAANAMMGERLVCKDGSIVLTMPRALKENQEMVKALSRNGDTMAVFMGVRELKDLVPLLLKYYPPATPVRIAYRVGYSNSRSLVKTTLGEVSGAAGKEKEQHLAMIYIGPCLK